MELLQVETPIPRNICVVRLITNMWADAAGMYMRRHVRFLRRRSVGFNFLEEDVNATSAYEVIPRIINLMECADGIYEMVTCNERRDWESGCVEEYDYKLIPLNVEPIVRSVAK